MASQTVVARVEKLEERVTVLEQLPARVDALTWEISQLRGEMRAEFAAIRAHADAGDQVMLGVFRDEICAGDEGTRRILRDEIRAGDEGTRRILRDEIRAGDEETRRIVRDEIRTGDEETRTVLRGEIRTTADAILTQMRVLHEEVIARIALIEEGRPRGRKRR
jgi:hypothetical protein